MRVKLQRVLCDDDGQEQTVTDIVTVVVKEKRTRSEAAVSNAS